MKRPVLILLIMLAVALGAAVLYFGQRDGRSAAAEPAAPPAPPSGPSGEMVAAMHRMHEATNKTPMTGDIDRDFVALMIPHHQSAVDMARVYLQSGRDPELRKMSEAIIASQEAEIRQMRGRQPNAAAAGPEPADPHAGH